MATTKMNNAARVFLLCKNAGLEPKSFYPEQLAELGKMKTEQKS
jgi:hypothetical protein